MRNLLAVLFFSLVAIGFFTGYSNYGIPQITPAPPPVEEEIEVGALTMDQFVALGGRIVEGRGTCMLCHNEVGGRAPLLHTVGSVIEERLADERHIGEATDAEGYLLESLVQPSAFVVVGFGKAGSSDTESPMPDVSTGSIGLSEVEIGAVVAYLQDLNGLDLTVEIPTGDAADTAATAEVATEAEPRALFGSVEEMIDEFACGACHIIGEYEGELGPDLSSVGTIRDREYLRRALLDPDADVAEDFEPGMMPPDLGEQLYAKELEMIGDYLSSLK